MQRRRKDGAGVARDAASGRVWVHTDWNVPRMAVKAVVVAALRYHSAGEAQGGGLVDNFPYGGVEVEEGPQGRQAATCRCAKQFRFQVAVRSYQQMASGSYANGLVAWGARVRQRMVVEEQEH